LAWGISSPKNFGDQTILGDRTICNPKSNHPTMKKSARRNLNSQSPGIHFSW